MNQFLRYLESTNAGPSKNTEYFKKIIKISRIEKLKWMADKWLVVGVDENAVSKTLKHYEWARYNSSLVRINIPVNNSYANTCSWSGNKLAIGDKKFWHNLKFIWVLQIWFNFELLEGYYTDGKYIFVNRSSLNLNEQLKNESRAINF